MKWEMCIILLHNKTIILLWFCSDADDATLPTQPQLIANQLGDSGSVSAFLSAGCMRGGSRDGRTLSAVGTERVTS